MTWKTPANIPQMLANTCKRPHKQISCSLGCFVSASSNLLLSDGNAPCFIQTIWVSCLLEKRLIVANAKKIIGTGGSRYDFLYIYIYYCITMYYYMSTILLSSFWFVIAFRQTSHDSKVRGAFRASLVPNLRPTCLAVTRPGKPEKRDETWDETWECTLW